MIKLTDNIYVENEISVCNSSLFVTGEGVVVIDTPMMPESAKKWAAQAAEFGPVRYVINTEPHGDHTTGNCYFGGALIAHEGVRDAILSSTLESVKEIMERHNPGASLDKDFCFRAPDITLKEKLTFYLGEYTFRLIHMPGHTPFQTVVYVPEAKAMFSSDNISRAVPFFHQAVPDIWLKTLKEMEKLDVEYIVPGHGEPGGPEILKEMYDNVTVWTEAVKSAIAKGMAEEEAVKTLTMHDLLPSLPQDDMSKGVIAMNVGAIYRYYKK